MDLRWNYDFESALKRLAVVENPYIRLFNMFLAVSGDFRGRAKIVQILAIRVGVEVVREGVGQFRKCFKTIPRGQKPLGTVF